MPSTDLYGIAGRAAGEAALEHGYDGSRRRSPTDAFLLSRIARAIVDALAAANAFSEPEPKAKTINEDRAVREVGERITDRIRALGEEPFLQESEWVPRDEVLAIIKQETQGEA